MQPYYFTLRSTDVHQQASRLLSLHVMTRRAVGSIVDRDELLFPKFQRLLPSRMPRRFQIIQGQRAGQACLGKGPAHLGKAADGSLKPRRRAVARGETSPPGREGRFTWGDASVRPSPRPDEESQFGPNGRQAVWDDRSRYPISRPRKRQQGNIFVLLAHLRGKAQRSLQERDRMDQSHMGRGRGCQFIALCSAKCPPLPLSRVV